MIWIENYVHIYKFKQGLTFGNKPVEVSTLEIAEELSLMKSYVTKSLSILEKTNVIIPVKGKDKRKKHYYLNYSFEKEGRTEISTKIHLNWQAVPLLEGAVIFGVNHPFVKEFLSSDYAELVVNGKTIPVPKMKKLIKKISVLKGTDVTPARISDKFIFKNNVRNSLFGDTNTDEDIELQKLLDVLGWNEKCSQDREQFFTDKKIEKTKGTQEVSIDYRVSKNCSQSSFCQNESAQDLIHFHRIWNTFTGFDTLSQDLIHFCSGKPLESNGSETPITSIITSINTSNNIYMENRLKGGSPKEESQKKIKEENKESLINGNSVSQNVQSEINDSSLKKVSDNNNRNSARKLGLPNSAPAESQQEADRNSEKRPQISPSSGEAALLKVDTLEDLKNADKSEILAFSEILAKKLWQDSEFRQAAGSLRLSFEYPEKEIKQLRKLLKCSEKLAEAVLFVIAYHNLQKRFDFGNRKDL